MSATALPSIAPSGKMIVVRFVDGSSTPTILKSVGATAPTLAINGGTPITLMKSAWGSDSTHTPRVPYGTYILYPLTAALVGTPWPIPANATATLTFADGTYTTVAGAVAGATLAVTNLAGGPSYGPAYDPDATKTMRVGTNLALPTNYMVCNFYANLIKQSGGVNGHDSLGYPTTFPAATSLVIDGAADPTDPLNYPSAPAGVWTVKWDGLKTANLTLTGGTATTVTLLTDVTGVDNVDHTRTYAVTVDATRHSPRVNLNFKAAGATNPRAYWPGEPTDGSELFGANTLRLAAGYKCLRFMNALWTNRSPVVDYTDFPTANQFSYKNVTTAQVGGTVASIGPYEEPDHNFIFNPNWARFIVTFAKPHRAKTGQVLLFGGPVATGTPGSVIVTTGGGTSQPIANAAGVVRVIDDVTLATAHYVPGTGGGGTITQTVNQPAGVTFTASIRQGMPVEHCALLSNEVGADCWVNVPHAATDACVAQMAATILANLAPGLKCYCEPSNEHWNTGLSFEQNSYYLSLGLSMPGYVGSGQEATAHATVTGTSVSALTIDTPSTAYVMAPQVTIAAPPPGGQRATAHATLIGGALALVLDSGGSGYSPASPPHVTISAALNPTPAYVWRAARAHAIFKAAFDAAGRSGDLVRVMGGQYETPNGITAPLVNAAKWNGIDFDALAVAPYYDNNLGVVAEPTMAPAFNLMDGDMLHDMAQLALIDGVFFSFFATHRALLDAGGFSHVKIVTYECSIQNGIPTGASGPLGRLSRAFGRHPRMRELYLFWLTQLQAGGVDLNMDFLLFSTTFGFSNWAKFLGYGQLPGMGDGSDGLNDNRAEYLDMSKFVSVMGGALNTWNESLTPPPPPPSHRPRALPTARRLSLPRRH